MASAKYAKISYIMLVLLVGCSVLEDFNYIDLAFVCFLIYTLIRYAYICRKY